MNPRECFNPMGPEFFTFETPGGIFHTRTLIANNESLDHGRNFNFWEKMYDLFNEVSHVSVSYMVWS